jgi:hypothetical protein
MWYPFGVHIGVYRPHISARNSTIQYKSLNHLSQDKKRGFGLCPAFAESPYAGFEVQGLHQQPNASRGDILNTYTLGVNADFAYCARKCARQFPRRTPLRLTRVA